MIQVKSVYDLNQNKTHRIAMNYTFFFNIHTMIQAQWTLKGTSDFMGRQKTSK